MLVTDVIDDLRATFDEFPAAGTWRVGVATHTDPDKEFFLVPEGMGEAFELEERPFSAQDFLEDLEAQPEWAGYVAYVRCGVIELPDGSVASRNMPLWGTGVHQDAQLVYFYYGASGSEP